MKRYKYSRILPLVMVLLLAFTFGVLAADSTGPEIVHDPVAEAPSNTPLVIEAEVKDDSRVQRVTLFMRAAGTNDYYKIPAKGKADGSYKAIIPSNFMAVGTLEYYFQAVDSQGNMSTIPKVNATGNPFEVAVRPDETTPEASLAAPKGLVGDTGFAVLILLNDKANNIASDTAEVYFNGKDLTQKARISARSIAFQVAARDIETNNRVLLKIADRAGNELEKSFRISQHPIISGSYDAGLSIDEDGSSIESKLELSAKWGGFSASADLEGEDLFFKNAESEFNLSYDSKLLDVRLIDTDTTLSDLTASGYSHRGLDIKTDLGPFNSVTAYGYAKPAIVGEQYGRRFLGMRQAFDFGLIKGGLNFNEVIDEIEGMTGDKKPATDPVQNYVLSIDNGISIYDFSIDSEFAASLYFDKATGNIWDSDLVESGDIPQIVQYLFPIPITMENILTQIDLGNNKIYIKPDFGGKMELKTPLPWSELSGSYYYYGPLFKTIAGSGDQDSQGFNVSFDTDRFAGLFDISLEYEQYRDNLEYLPLTFITDDMKGEKLSEDLPLTFGDLIDIFEEFIGSGTPMKYTDYEGEVGLYTELFDTTVGYSHQEEADYNSGTLQTDENTISIKVKNIKFKIGDWDTSLRTSLSTAKENGYDVTGKNVISSKETNKGSIKTSIERGPWEHGVGYSNKIETDNDGTEAQSPTLSISNSWSKKDLTLGGYTLYKFGVESDLSLTNTITSDDSEEEQKLEYELELDIRPAQTYRWVLSYNHIQTTDNIDSSNNSTTNSAELKYSIDF